MKKSNRELIKVKVFVEFEILKTVRGLIDGLGELKTFISSNEPTSERKIKCVLDLFEKVGFRVTNYESSKCSEITKLIDELKSEAVSKLNIE